MQTRKPINIPVVSPTAQADAATGSSCSGKDMVALMVLGDSMAPEFVDGEILVIEPDLPAFDGSLVIGWLNDEYIFRQVLHDEEGGWRLHALNPDYSDAAISGLDAIRGVVTHQKKPDSRKSVKFYVDVHPADPTLLQRT
jgi:DNA polymerase V